MGSAIPKVDESVGWPNLPCCPYRHKVSSPCPLRGVWMVLVLCAKCDPKTQIYCGNHGPTNWWLTAMSGGRRARPEVPEVDIQQWLAGEDGDER